MLRWVRRVRAAPDAAPLEGRLSVASEGDEPMFCATFDR